jgi:hypothetical protein
MRSTVRFPSVLKLGLALTLVLPGVAGSAWAKRPRPKAAAAQPAAPKKSAQEISSTDDALQKQMDWENKILGPNNEKKIDLAKIQKLQAEETARREKQDKIDRAEKERRDREAERTAAAQRNVSAPSSREVPEIEETPPPPPKVEKHDDAFVDRLLKDKGTTKKKSVAATNDDVDQLLNAAKQEKPAGAGSKSKGGKVDTVDQLLATADKQPTIKTTTKRPTVTDEPVSAEAAAREAAMKAIAAAQAKADEERSRNRKPVVPDAAMLRGREEASARANPSAAPATSRQAPSGASRASWSDPFAGEDSDASPTSRRSKVTTAVRPPSPAAEIEQEPTPAPRRSSAHPGSPHWKDPFDGGEGAPAPRARPAKSAPAGKSKHPANWKDPFA